MWQKALDSDTPPGAEDKNNYFYFMKLYEKSLRSLTKAITFRLVIIVSDSIILYVVTRRLAVIVTVIVFSNLASTILYFLHERVWNRVHWGKLEMNRIK